MENKKVIIIDESKKVQIKSLYQLFGYCGTVKTIEVKEIEEFNYYEVEYAEETEAACAVYMNNTLVDNTQIKVQSYTEFMNEHPSLKQSSIDLKQSNLNQSEIKENKEEIDIIDLNEMDENETISVQSEKPNEIQIQNEPEEKEKKKGSKKEKLNQKAKEFGEKTQTAFNHLQTFIVDCAVDTKQAIDKRRNKNQLPQYDLPEDHSHSENFEKKTFVIEQKEMNQSDENSQMQNVNNLKKKPLPSIPQPK